ncbi:MAG: hypothetical protein K5905_30145 [Roseibium sp.]|uniref:hypothetical protein n=1 Tax=Roseibium sp. TaxID=1936156 RepID=UPI002616D654|nr:hypothetical protein [Roseibium sp.]MCV0429721.1 hypothetical protein [Roseibium sp.]
MAKAMTAASQVYPPKGMDDTRVEEPVQKGGNVSVPFLLAKNLLFWGSVSLSLYGIYAVFSLI